MAFRECAEPWMAEPKRPRDGLERFPESHSRLTQAPKAINEG
jgi:hypothetical protein